MLSVVKRVAFILLFRSTPTRTHHFEGHYAPKQRQRCVTHENCEAIYRIVGIGVPGVVGEAEPFTIEP